MSDTLLRRIFDLINPPVTNSGDLQVSGRITHYGSYRNRLFINNQVLAEIVPLEYTKVSADINLFNEDNQPLLRLTGAPENFSFMMRPLYIGAQTNPGSYHLAVEGNASFHNIKTDSITTSEDTVFSLNSIGMVLPKCSTATRNAIVSPSVGLQVYDTDLLTICIYNGTQWIISGQQNNVINEPFRKIHLTSTWVAYGDSFSQTGGAWGLTWPSYLATKTGTTVINRAIGATQTNTLTGSGDSKLPNFPVLNAAYANYTSIIMYGFNDTRHNGTLYSNPHWHQLMTMGGVLQLAVPQNKIIDAKNFTTKSGSWTNVPTVVADFGTYSATAGNYIEHNLGTCRYIAIQQFVVVGQPLQWTVEVNGTFIQRIGSASIPTVLSGHGYFAIGYIIDMGVEASHTIRFTNGLSATNYFVNWVCPYTEAEAVASARNVLMLSIPRFNMEYTGGSPYNTPSEAKRKAIEDGFVDIARTCRKNKLPVSFCYLQNSGLNFYFDNIHPSTKQSENWADEIIANALD